MSAHKAYYFICFFTFLPYLLANNCENFEVKMKQTLLKPGFRRRLSYDIVFETKGKGCNWLSGCTIGLDQTLPAGTYVNPDELEDLKRFDKLNAVLKNKVNIELPAEQSHPINVFMIDNLTSKKINFKLPVHARYHKAVSGGGTSRIEIGPPKLFLMCKNSKLGKSTIPAKFLCSGSKEKCWKEINYTMLTDTIIWHMPVGNLDHYYQVTILTGVVVVIGSLYLLKALHENKPNMNYLKSAKAKK